MSDHGAVCGRKGSVPPFHSFGCGKDRLSVPRLPVPKAKEVRNSWVSKCVFARVCVHVCAYSQARLCMRVPSLIFAEVEIGSSGNLHPHKL